ncbi:MAG: GNAT family N-acetyltransferase [Bacteroidetes bacterium]|nr:GNAT family N-acetyltransferase [Bacteroidota bacterium]
MQPFIKILEWDSDFFNFNVGKIEGDIQNEKDVENIIFMMEQRNFKLAYYDDKTELSSFVFNNLYCSVKLIDKKTIYVKTINPKLEIHPSIISVDSSTQYLDQLINLALQSGVYSRFNIDKNFEKGKFEEMYKLWLVNSLSRKIAKEVLVYQVGNQIAGFVTIGDKNNRADIGIIAVDYNFRGQGIGKYLMASAEKWFSNLGYDSIQVVTQGENKPACSLYENCGYKVENAMYFYHFWKK